MGIVTGLACGQAGESTLQIEVNVLSEKILLTGQMGDVMKVRTGGYQLYSFY
ncbi:MAG: S16 family serine protease [Sellimonas intestinalis]